jgi:hypothetical protein
LTADVKVPAGTITGAYTVKVTNPDHSFASCTNCFRIIAAPTLTKLDPSNAAQGSKTSVTLTGNGFAAGATAKGPSGVTFSQVAVTNSTTITATMTVSASASTGSGLSVIVTNNAAAGYGVATGAVLKVT